MNIVGMERYPKVADHRQQQEQRARRARTWRVDTLWFGAGAAVLLGAALMLALAPLRSVRAPAREGTVSRPVVVVTMAGFQPSRLNTPTGADVILTFVNPDSKYHVDGGGWHQFRIEALGVDVRIPPRTQQTVNFGPLPAGAYEFYCDICCGGKENPAMRGVLEVTG